MAIIKIQLMKGKEIEYKVRTFAAIDNYLYIKQRDGADISIDLDNVKYFKWEGTNEFQGAIT